MKDWIPLGSSNPHKMHLFWGQSEDTGATTWNIILGKSRNVKRNIGV